MGANSHLTITTACLRPRSAKLLHGLLTYRMIREICDATGELAGFPAPFFSVVPDLFIAGDEPHETKSVWPRCRVKPVSERLNPPIFNSPRSSFNTASSQPVASLSKGSGPSGCRRSYLASVLRILGLAAARHRRLELDHAAIGVSGGLRDLGVAVGPRVGRKGSATTWSGSAAFLARTRAQ